MRLQLYKQPCKDTSHPQLGARSAVSLLGSLISPAPDSLSQLWQQQNGPWLSPQHPASWHRGHSLRMSLGAPHAPHSDESPHFLGLARSPGPQVVIAPLCVFTWLKTTLRGFITINRPRHLKLSSVSNAARDSPQNESKHKK